MLRRTAAPSRARLLALVLVAGGVPTAAVEVHGTLTAPLERLADCTLDDPDCVPPDLRFQYSVPADALPPWLLRDGPAPTLGAAPAGPPVRP